MEGVDNNQSNQPGGTESHSSPGHNLGQRRWEAEEEPKDEQMQHEDEGSTSGVCDSLLARKESLHDWLYFRMLK